ncbi:SusC/RagA family TonB-linked outer membrane protein [Spirosoma sp. KUDC1026]|uniref:SusC/RagA family TonB-linked outer membrane protein n=1 Tax=Spirosoma sp. KUDC1026 TaxID=2745947 RepID=UPI00159B9F38|nr:SusC/RagA family TonB-linked outer membrane protein [Spirosoma sp. KUDC1026]
MTNHYPLTGRYFYLSWILWLMFFISSNALAQSNAYTLKGRITDNTGASLPGVTVQLTGTTNGTASDADGNYQFSVNQRPGEYVLTFSAVGYAPVKKPITLANVQTVTTDATLGEDVANLDEVVVVGSTIQTTRRELGNTINTIRAENLAQSGSGGLLNSLQGKVPGAQITQNSGDPAGGITVRLRGVKSLGGPSDPLYVVDGVIVSNTSQNVSQLAVGDQIGGANPGTNRLADINPNDIATINVINGAAAAAQYGSRAINGVVLITTKRGQTGAPRVTLTTSININELRKSVPITTYGKQFGYASLRLHPIAALTDQQLPTYSPQTGETFVRILRDGAYGSLRTNLVDVTRYNYFDQIFRTGIGTDNNLSVSGGRENTQYYVSFGYLKNEGIIKGTDFRRYNLRARVDQRLTNWAKLSVGLSYINSFSNEKANGNVFYSPINAVNITNNIYDITQRDASGNLLAVEPTRVNPLSTIEDMKFTQAVSRTINDVQLNLTPLPGLSVDAVVGVDSYSQLGNSYIRPYPYQATAGLPLERYPNGYAATATNSVLQFNSDINATYQRDLTSALNLKVIAGFNYQYNQQDFSQQNGQNLAPFIETVSGAASTTVRAGYGLNRYNLSGVFGQATLGFRNLAFLTGALRQDRSTLFSPSETNQLYPKVSGSVVVSDLGFWKNSGISSTWNSLKLRASYGDAGGLTAIGPNDRFYQYNPVPFLGKNTILPSSTLSNPAVRPERMTELEGGADLSLFGDKVNLSITAYRQRIRDLTVRRTLAASTGGTELVTNVGEMENKGVEIMLDLVPVRTKSFSWDLTFIYNQNRNKILALTSPRIEQANVTGAPVFQIVGQPASVFFGTAYARNADGSLLLTTQGLPQQEKGAIYTATATKPVEQVLTEAGINLNNLPAGSYELAGTYYIPQRDASGQPTGTLLRKVIGNPNPKWTGSISSGLTYKAVSLRFLVDFVQGVSVFNADKRTRQGVGIGDFVEKEMKGELQRGYIYSIYPIEEWRIDNGSFVKLREVSLSYQVPTFIKGLTNLRVSAIGRNLISWDNYNGFDPETNAGGNSDLLRGIDFGNVPIPRTYQLQLTASF